MNRGWDTLRIRIALTLSVVAIALTPIEGTPAQSQKADTPPPAVPAAAPIEIPLELLASRPLIRGTVSTLIVVPVKSVKAAAPAKSDAALKVVSAAALTDVATSLSSTADAASTSVAATPDTTAPTDSTATTTVTANETVTASATATAVAAPAAPTSPTTMTTIGATAPIALLFDPEARMNVIDGGVPERMKVKLPPNATEFRFELGFETLNLPRVAFVPGDTSPYVPELGRDYRPRGIVGLSLWKDQLVTLDYLHWKMRVEPGRLADVDNVQIFAIDAASGQLRVPLIVAGRELLCRIDPLYPGGIVLPASYLLELPLDGKPAPVSYTDMRDGSVAVREAKLNTNVTFAGIEMDKPTVLFGEIGTGAVIGYQALAGLTITYDLANGRARIGR